MHLLVRETRSLDEEESAVDLGQTPADIVFLSFSDADLGAAAMAWQALQGAPTVRLANLARLRAELGAVGGSWLQPLKDSEFLAAIKHRSAIPGGTCEFDLPDYFFWLNQPAEARTEAFARWLALLRPLCDAIAELLWLTRQNGRARDQVAAGGVFNVTFDRDAPYQLLRICLPPDSPLYPEISGSHYRCSMRFLQWNGIEQRATQTDAEVAFRLVCCS